MYAWYNLSMREKEFINKVHKHLPKEIYKWKINDPYHGGVPDTFYSGPEGHCFIEYKYTDKLPSKSTSKIKLNLSVQQRIWLTQQAKHNIFTYAVLGSGDRVYVTEDFTIANVTLEEFNKNSISFTVFVEVLINFCLGEQYVKKQNKK
jgi:hypothetical protein|tara:strand:- start:173 stop:616 length:444 start_codon:yes stop_codon:yes gene_type:complete